MTTKFKACENLIFNIHQIDKRINLTLLDDGSGVYWKRPKEICEENSEVQFCNLRGRLNEKTACINGNAHCSEYKSKDFFVKVK